MFNLDNITEWLELHPQFISAITFVIGVIESIPIIGLIIPCSVVMIMIGVFVGTGDAPFWTVLSLAALGAVVGDCTAYTIGHYFSNVIPKIWPFSRHPAMLINGQSFINHHGATSVFIGRFVGAIRSIVPVMAGILHMRFRPFIIASVISSVLWSPIYMLPGILVGAASTDLSPHAIGQLIIVILVVIALIWLITKIIKYVFAHAKSFFTPILHRQWLAWKNQPNKQWLCNLLIHAERPEGIEQLALAISALIVFLLFIALMTSFVLHASYFSFLNQTVLNFFQSIRTPWLDTIMIAISSFGSKTIILPFVMVIFIWFVLNRRLITATHWIGSAMAIGAAVFIFKYISHIPRPTETTASLFDSSFPSGHVAPSIVIYGFLAYLLATQMSTRNKKIIYWITATLLFLIAISRMYLAAHWLTDVIGAILLATTILTTTIISYQRHKPATLNTTKLIIVSLITLALLNWLYLHYKFARDVERYQPTKQYYNATLDKMKAILVVIKSRAAPHH